MALRLTPRVRTACISLALVTPLVAGCASTSSEPAASPTAVEQQSATSGTPRTESTSSGSSTDAPVASDSGSTDASALSSAAPSAAPVSADSQQQQQQQRSTARDRDEYPPVEDTPQNVAVVAVHPDPTRPDPMHGHFTLAQATAGLPAGNDLVADIETSMGTFTCSMLQTEAPITVANFVGLARGVRDFWDPVAGRWTRRPFYDGSVLHRVIPDFMIQGGDILRSGRGGPGYTIPDENVTDHDAAGLLCMANRGPNTGGAQFFITEHALPRLNGSYSVFGRCTPVELVLRIARVPRSRRDQPITPVYIRHVTVHR